MTDREKIIKVLEKALAVSKAVDGEFIYITCGEAERALELLKAQDQVIQKMWNALYAEEDRLEKDFAGTDKHDEWFTVCRLWLQNGFEIGLKVIAELLEQEGGEAGCG